MSDYRPEVGHRVRIVLEGTVIKDSLGYVRVKLNTGSTLGDWVLESATSVERLPDRPEVRHGDVVVDSAGTVWRRSGTFSWTRIGSDMVYDDRQPIRPLTLLVRDGKPVSQS